MGIPLKYPNFYKIYDWRSMEEENNDFFGRKMELEEFWRELHNLTHVSGKKNLAYVGHRKLGKTAFLKRCYNVAFWEQDKILPYYFSFPQQNDEVIQLESITEEIVLEFIKQAVCFITKDLSVLSIPFEEEIYFYMEEKKIPNAEFLVRILKIAAKKRKNLKRSVRLAAVWKLCDIIARVWGKKTLLIIDEAQEMDVSIYEDEKHIPCRSSIADVIQQNRVLTIVSGSLVSVLVHKFLDYKISNRFRRCDFFPLQKKDACDMIKKYCDGRGYSGIEVDVHELLGGNPFYIQSLFLPNNRFFEMKGKKKEFHSREKLNEAYKFEVFHEKGEIFRFWQTHFQINVDALNNDPKGKKGLAVKILYEIATSNKRSLFFEELANTFNIKMDELERKVAQLRNADLIESPPIGKRVYKIIDKVLAVLLAHLYQDFLFDSEKEAQAEIDRLTTLEKVVQEVKEEIKELQEQKLVITKGFSAARGLMNLRKGIKREGEVHRNIKKGIKKKQGIFQDYESDGKFYNINISTSNGSGCQIDLYTTLKSISKNKSVTLMAEVKHHKNKIGKPQIEKFIATLLLAKKQHKLKSVMAVYISTSGFTKPAEKMLENHGIYFGRSEKEFLDT